MKLVTWTIKRYYDKNILEYDDYFQTGTIGLMKSIETYDPEKGSFSNYTIYSIKQAITRDIENYGRTIRVPSHMIAKINKLKAIQEELTTLLEREPTLLEISKKAKLPLKEVKEILTVADDPISLNIPTSTENESITLEGSIEDDSPSPDEVVENKIFIEKYQEEAKKSLSETQNNIINMYLGIGTREHTLKEIAEIYNAKTIQPIRTERDKGLRTLRRTRYFQDLMKEFEEETSYYKSVDYSSPRVVGGLPSSSVENIVLDREKRLERLKQKI